MEQADVVDAVAHHNQPVQPDVHVKPGELRRVEARRAQDVRVRRAARHYLDPADVLAHAATLASADETAHVDLVPRLDEREKPDAHPRRHVAPEYLRQNAFYHHVPGRKSEIPVHDQRLVLEERALVPRVRRLVPVDPAGVDEAERRLARPQIPHARAGQVRPQAQPVAAAPGVVPGEPVRVHALARRVLRREVEIVERVKLAGDLGLLKNFKAHRAEGVVQVVAHLSDRVKRATARRSPGDGEVEVRRYRRGGKAYRLPARLDQRREMIFQLVRRPPHFGTDRSVGSRYLL